MLLNPLLGGLSFKTSISVLSLSVLSVLPILEYSLLRGALLDSHKIISSCFYEPKTLFLILSLLPTYVEVI